MSRERVYPEERAGPFAEPPFAFTDREGREIEVRASQPGADVPEALVEMYAAFDPADRAQGIPPTDAEAARAWLETIYADGYNAVAWHGDDAAGHATLVPADGGKASNAGDQPRHPQNAGDRARTNADAGAPQNAGDRAQQNAGDRSRRNASKGPRQNDDDRALVTTDDRALAAAGDRSPAGDASAAGVEDPSSQGPYELAIFVLQSYQRAGIGTRLLEGVLGYAQSAGIERVWLSVERWNTAAIDLYRTVGFETADTRSFELEMAIRL